MTDGPYVIGEACPRCPLPRDEGAWQCDGCGLEFRHDTAAVRADLRSHLTNAWCELGLIVLLGAGVLAVLLLLSVARPGMGRLAGGVLIAMLGGMGHAVFRIRSGREHMRELDRRHAPLPAAVARPAPGRGTRGD